MVAGGGEGSGAARGRAAAITAGHAHRAGCDGESRGLQRLRDEGETRARRVEAATLSICEDAGKNLGGMAMLRDVMGAETDHINQLPALRNAEHRTRFRYRYRTRFRYRLARFSGAKSRLQARTRFRAYILYLGGIGVTGCSWPTRP